MQAAHRVAKNTGILYARMAITVFISLYSTRLILAALGVADFGLFNLVGGVIAMLGFLNSSMAAASQRFMSFAQGEGDIEKVKRIFNMSSLLHWGIAVMVFLLLEGAGYFFFHGFLNITTNRLEVAKLIYQFMIVSTLFTVISVPYEAVITSHENMMVYAVMGVIEAVLKLLIAFYITYTGMDHLVMYGILMATLSIFLLIIKRVYCHIKYTECKLNIRANFDKPLLKDIRNFAGLTLLDSSSSMIANYSQGVLLNVFFGSLVNAAQGISLQICGQLATLSNTILTALNPIIDKKAGAKEKLSLIKITILSSKITYITFAFIAIPIIIELHFLFKIWLIKVPFYAIIFSRLLIIRTLIEMLFVIISTSINAIGDIKEYKIYSSIINLFPILISYVLFKNSFPPYFLYIVFIFFSIITSFIKLKFAEKVIGISMYTFFIEVIVKCIFVTILTVIIILIPSYFLEEGFIRFLITLILGISMLLYFTWIFVLKYDEKKVFKKIITSLFVKYRIY